MRRRLVRTTNQRKAISPTVEVNEPRSVSGELTDRKNSPPRPEWRRSPAPARARDDGDEHENHRDQPGDAGDYVVAAS
jgi:hypothetical protein